MIDRLRERDPYIFQLKMACLLVVHPAPFRGVRVVVKIKEIREARHFPYSS